MDETYIRKRVSQVYSQSYGGNMIDKFTALIVELLNKQAAQHSVHPTCATCGDSGRGLPTLSEPDGAENACPDCGTSG